MKIVFMGTPEFAVPALENIAKQHTISAVVTAPDRPAGRGKQLRKSAVKEAAEKLNIKVLQPLNLKSAEFQSELQALNADLFVVVAFRMLPEAVWSMPRYGTINLHASLLPQYRGAAPINRAVMAGEKVTGLTTFSIEKEIDTGNILDQIEIPVGENQTAGELHDHMMEIGADLLVNTIEKIATGKISPVEQSAIIGSELQSAPKIFKEDCMIDWKQNARTVHNHIRGLSPYPGAITAASDNTDPSQNFKILKSAVSDESSTERPGTVQIRGKEMWVATNDCWLKILEIQAPGKRSLPVDEFLRGYKRAEELNFS
jgi:methionyl-tRNA formyltransferase